MEITGEALDTVELRRKTTNPTVKQKTAGTPISQSQNTVYERGIKKCIKNIIICKSPFFINDTLCYCSLDYTINYTMKGSIDINTATHFDLES